MRTEDVQAVKVGADDANLRRKSVTGRFPVLEHASEGVIVCDSLPIARYLAREHPQFTDGANAAQKAQIDTWVDYIQANVVPVASRVTDQVLGRVPSDPRTFANSLNDLKQALQALDAHLALRNFLVGYQMSLADALLVSTLSLCFELVLDKKTRDD